jgi:hypothetical protein
MALSTISLYIHMKQNPVKSVAYGTQWLDLSVLAIILSFLASRKVLEGCQFPLDQAVCSMFKWK